MHLDRLYDLSLTEDMFQKCSRMLNLVLRMRNYISMKIVSVVFTLILTFQVSKASTALNHPFYVSIIQLDHNLQNKSLEITFKIFTDDLEKSIAKESGVNLYLTGQKEYEKSDSLIFSYLKRHFQLSPDDKICNLKFIGFEASFDVTKIYLEAEGINPNLSKIKIESDILVSEIPEQSNVFHYQKNDDIKSLILNRSNTIGEILIE